MTENILKVAYVHGRTGPHPMQGLMAKSVGGEYVVVDFRIRWHDIPASPFRRYLSWIVCALSFPNVKKYDIFLAAGPHYSVVLMKVLKQLRKNQKIVVHLGDETLYSLHTKRYSKTTQKIMIWALNKFDAVICEGKMGSDLARQLLKDDALIYTVFPGIPTEHYKTNKTVIPDLKSKNIIFMGNGPSGFRLWYKGLDLLVESFALARNKVPGLTLTIVGEWDTNAIEQLLSGYNNEIRNAIHFADQTNNLNEHLEKCSLYVHCARGEAFGITILIAMLAGVVPVVSEWTGAKEAVEQIDRKLITPLDKSRIAESIVWYFDLSEDEKKRISDESRKIAEGYTQEKALHCYQDTFRKMAMDLKLTKQVNKNSLP
jgi:glycosyltransferase involved in cell wall biosynthesis